MQSEGWTGVRCRICISQLAEARWVPHNRSDCLLPPPARQVTACACKRGGGDYLPNRSLSLAALEPPSSRNSYAAVISRGAEDLLARSPLSGQLLLSHL